MISGSVNFPFFPTDEVDTSTEALLLASKKKRENRVSQDIDNASNRDTKFSYSLKPMSKFNKMYLTRLGNNKFEREKPCDKKRAKNLITDRCITHRKLFHLNGTKQ